MVMGAGALHPFSVRQVATPRPWLPPTPTAILTIEGTTAIHFAFFMTLSGIALSGTFMISSSTRAEASMCFSISDWSALVVSSCAHVKPVSIETRPKTRRHFSHIDDFGVICPLFRAGKKHSRMARQSKLTATKAMLLSGGGSKADEKFTEARVDEL